VKVAKAGTIMVRRSDVMHLFSRSYRKSIAAMHLAQDEGRHADAEIFLARIRAIKSVRDDLFIKIPAFINPQDINEEPAAVGTLSLEDTSTQADAGEKS
jgi:hypothetical protein